MLQKLRELRECCTTRVAVWVTALSATCGGLCVHPCLEHLLGAAVVWVIGLFAAFRGNS